MILLFCEDCGHKLINNVYYVPKFKINILMLGYLLKKGYDILMKNLHLWLGDLSNNIIVKVHKTKHRLISLYLQTINAKCLKVNVQDDSWFWHMRLGNLNFEDLKWAGDKNIVDGIPSINDPNQLCVSRLLGVHAMRNFPEKTILRTSKLL